MNPSIKRLVDDIPKWDNLTKNEQIRILKMYNFPDHSLIIDYYNQLSESKKCKIRDSVYKMWITSTREQMLPEGVPNIPYAEGSSNMPGAIYVETDTNVRINGKPSLNRPPRFS